MKLFHFIALPSYSLTSTHVHFTPIQDLVQTSWRK